MNHIERYQQLVAERSEWNNIFEETAKYVWPQAKNIVKSVKSPYDGQILTVDIADSTAILAAHRMTSGIFSYLMPVGVKWFDLKPSADMYLKDREMMRRASEATQIIHSAIWRSNFQREMFNTIHSMGVLGTGCISVEKVDGKLVFRNYHIADIFFCENSKGVIDTVYRRMFYTARQMKQEFGEENLSDEVKKCLAGKEYGKKFEVVHCVYPRTDYDDSKKDYKGKKFVSEYYELATKKELKESGFDSMSYLIGRFGRSPDELMGRSIAMDLLPDIKMLNNMRFTFAESSEKQGNPPILLEDDSVLGQPAVGPGDIITYRAGSAKPEPMATGVNSQLNYEIISQERQAIREGFFNDLFQALAAYGSRERKTQLEVSQLVEEKMVMLAPTVSSLQKEMLDPLIMRVYDLLVGTPELPEGIGADVDIAYQGRLALAMSAIQTNGIELTLAKWSPYQQFYPVLDNMNLDKAFVTSALNAGVPADLIYDEMEVNERRQEQMEMQKAQQQAELAATASQAIKNVQGSSLEGMLG